MLWLFSTIRLIIYIFVWLSPAQAYMPRGQTAVRVARQCDTAALLNLINFCDCFPSVDLKCVREVKTPRIPHWLKLCRNKCFVSWKMDALPVNPPHPCHWILVLAGDPVQKWTDALIWAQCQWRLDGTVLEKPEKDHTGPEPWRGCGGATDSAGELCSPQLECEKISSASVSRCLFCPPASAQMLSVNLSICVLDDEPNIVYQCVSVSDTDSPARINGHMISYWEVELLQERLQEFLQAASDGDGDGDDAAKTQVWQFKLSRLNAYTVFRNSDSNRVSPPGRRAVEEAAGFPPGQQRSEQNVFCRAPGHQQRSGGQPRR